MRAEATKRGRIRLVARGIVLALTLTAASARAQLHEAFEAPAPGGARLGVAYDEYVQTTGRHLVAPDLTFDDTRTWWAQLVVGELDLGEAVIRAALPLAYYVDSTSGTVSSHYDQAELGNVELEGHASIDLDLGSNDHRLLIGGGVALPTATDQPCVGCGWAGAVVRLGAWQSSFRNAAAWADRALTIWPSVEYRYGGSAVLVTAAGTVAVFFPVDSAVGGPQPLARGMVELMLALDVSAALRIAEIVDVGLAFLAWALPSGAGYRDLVGITPDLGQTALTFFVRTDPALAEPVFAGAEMIFDLDPEWGPTGELGRVWGLRVLVGVRFDV